MFFDQVLKEPDKKESPESAKYDSCGYSLHAFFSWIWIRIFCRSGSGLRNKRSDPDPDKRTHIRNTALNIIQPFKFIRKVLTGHNHDKSGLHETMGGGDTIGPKTCTGTFSTESGKNTSKNFKIELSKKSVRS